jgi:hypothetical protein
VWGPSFPTAGCGGQVAKFGAEIGLVNAAYTADAPPIRIGALPTVSTQIMPRAMKLFLAEGAGATIKIVTGENAVLLEQ